jgi:uncharacterized membrane protein
MNHEAEKYLQEINRRLSDIPEHDREDILLEIKNHIYEATEKGEEIAQILARLGSPVKLAKAYSLGYCAENKKLKPLDILNYLDFYLLSGLSGIFIIPLLGFLAVVFLAIAIWIPGTAVVNLLGFTHVPMFVWGDSAISPGMLQIALGLIIGAVFAWLTYICWSGIKDFIKEIAANYRKLKIGK